VTKLSAFQLKYDTAVGDCPFGGKAATTPLSILFHRSTKGCMSGLPKRGISNRDCFDCGRGAIQETVANSLKLSAIAKIEELVLIG